MLFDYAVCQNYNPSISILESRLESRWMTVFKAFLFSLSLGVSQRIPGVLVHDDTPIRFGF